MMHECGVCYLPADLHSSQCREEDNCCRYFILPLCCRGCPCLSFEEAHLELLKIGKSHYRVSVAGDQIGFVRKGYRFWGARTAPNVFLQPPYYRRRRDAVDALLQSTLEMSELERSASPAALELLESHQDGGRADSSLVE